MKNAKEKRKKANSQAGREVFTVGPDDGAEETAAHIGSESESKKPDRIQLSFDLKPDGSPDFSSMREKTKERMRDVFSNPLLGEQLGIRTLPPPSDVFHPSMISGMYDMLGTIEQSLFPMFFPKVSEHIWKRVFTYTPEEKAALVPPTTRVINKYASEWMIRWQDEIMLATLLVTITTAKVNAAVMLSRMNHPQPVSEMPKPEEPAKPEPVQ
jgi:hypothetical protein